MSEFTFGSLFSGVGGMDLGLEWAGMECRWTVEWESYPQAVLNLRWPDVPKYSDVRDVDPCSIEPVDLICGGFPCQPHSVAAADKRKGVDDERWLWPEFFRIARVLRPRYILVENVPGLLTVNDGGAFREILGNLSSIGYDAEWDVIPALAFGAPHLRYRLFIVAYPKSGEDYRGEPGDLVEATRTGGRSDTPTGSGREDAADSDRYSIRVESRGRLYGKRRKTEEAVARAVSEGKTVSHTDRSGRKTWPGSETGESGRLRGRRSDDPSSPGPMADPDSDGQPQPIGVQSEGRGRTGARGTQELISDAPVIGGKAGIPDSSPGQEGDAEKPDDSGYGDKIPDADCQHDDRAGHDAGSVLGERSGQARVQGCTISEIRVFREPRPYLERGETLDASRRWWSAEPRLGRMVNGTPDRVDRLRAIGNAVIPAITLWIGRRIIEWEKSSSQ